MAQAATMTTTAKLSARAFLAQLFGSKAARDGAVIRRKLRDVEQYAGREAFEQELARRGCRALDNAGQIVIVRNQEPIRVVQ